MNRGRSYITSVGLTAAGLSLIAPAVAQEVSGLSATFGVKQSLETSDNLDLANPANSGARAVTELSFGLLSETRTSRLEFDTSGNLEFDETETGFQDPSVSLSYVTSSRNSELSLDVNYTERDVNALTTVFADNGGFGLEEQLVIGTGVRLSSGAKLRFETGMDAPLGFIFDAAYRGTDFRDTVDPDLFQTERLTYGATVRMRGNDAITMRVGGKISTDEAKNSSNTVRDNTRLFWESDFDIRSDLTATTSLSYSRNETTTSSVVGGFGLTLVDNTTTNEGFGGSFAITKTLKSGTIGASFDTRVTSDGRRDTVRLTRAIQLPRGDFSLSVGAVKTETSSLQPLINMNYNQELPRGLMTLGLSQQSALNEDDETVINTRLQASYNQQINSPSSGGLTASLADTDAVDLEDDTRRLNLGVNYRREMARDWDLVANYTYSTAEDSNDPVRTSNTVSLSIERAFEFRP